MSIMNDDALLVAVIHYCHSVWCNLCRPRILRRRLLPYLEKLALYWKQIRIVDLTKAFDMGLESGLYVLEKSINLPAEDRLYLLEKLKKIIYGKLIKISQDEWI